MIAPRKVRCQVITIDAPAEASASTAKGSRPRFRPSEMVPWGDPFISGLVHKLQAEVRSEVRSQPAASKRLVMNGASAPVADLEWPWDEGVADFEPVDREPVETELPGATETWNRGDRFSM